MDWPDLVALAQRLPPERLEQVTSDLPQAVRVRLMQSLESVTVDLTGPRSFPKGPAEQAVELDSGYVIRPHIQHISDRIAKAVDDVSRGTSRWLIIETPPRAGKSTLVSVYSPLWILRQHPSWKIALVSYDSGLTTEWARNMRAHIEETPDLGITLAKDGGAAATWHTIAGGGVRARSTGRPLTGTGAKVLLIDDPVKDYVAAHSMKQRDGLWNWWQSVANTRLEAPTLVITTMTRWHDDDLIGRLLSSDYAGDPDMWERLRIPAIAEPGDLLGRAEGEPLISPLIDETPEEAVNRWATVKEAVGSYVFAAMYQQRPAPDSGAIFDTSWWKFWTTDPARANGDDVVYFDPADVGRSGRWVDSWDCNFGTSDGTTGTTGSYVVGQRWVRHKADRYLIAQQRGRYSFPQTLDRMRAWAGLPCKEAIETTVRDNAYGNFVHTRLVEDKANGTAILATMRREISGLKPINPRTSKEGRARSVLPEIESGNVFLPHPGDPGNEWVRGLLDELRDFPSAAHDDQVDSMTQALTYLREGGGSISTPVGRTQITDRAAASRTQRSRLTTSSSRSIPPGRRFSR